jgi:hypothetical protein
MDYQKPELITLSRASGVVNDMDSTSDSKAGSLEESGANHDTTGSSKDTNATTSTTASAYQVDE